MNGSFLSDLCARIILGGILGIILAMYNQVNIPSLYANSVVPFFFVFCGLVIVMAVMMVKKCDKAGFKFYGFVCSLTAIFWDDLVGVFMFLSGVCLGALLVNLALSIVGFNKEIFPFFIAACFFIFASFSFHHFPFKLNQK